MSDECDWAATEQMERTERALTDRLQRRMMESKPSASTCEDCGVPIPKERQQHALGCTRCVACQAVEERRRKQYVA